MPEGELEPIEEGATTPPLEPDTPASYGGNPAAPNAPNSFYWPFGRSSPGHRAPYISWQSDSPIAVLAFVIFVLILLAMGALAVIASVYEACTGHAAGWLPEVMKVLGQALLTVVGAIVGASAQRTAKKDDD